MKKTVWIAPNYSFGGGVGEHIRILREFLPKYGWEVANDRREGLISHVHAAEYELRPDVYTNHGIHPMNATEPWKVQQNRAIFRNLRVAKHVIAVSNHTLGQWENLVGRPWATTHVIPNCINPLDPKYHVTGNVWRDRMRIQRTTPLIVWGKTGVDSVCDPSPAIEVALQIPEAVVALTVNAEQLTWFPDNVHPLGPLDPVVMQQLLKDCDVYLATTKENHSIQVLEALWWGKPVVGYDWGGTAETLKPVQSFAALCDPGDMDMLVMRVREMLARDQDLVSHEAVGRAIMYKADTIIPQVVEVYEQALADNFEMRPRLSFVVTCHNKGPFITETLKSVLDQSERDIEVIVVDDASTDDSVARINALLDETGDGPDGMKMVQVVSFPENQGVVEARNFGIDLATAELITCLDGDDLVHPQFVETLVPFMEVNPDLGLVYSDMAVLYERDGKPVIHVLDGTDYDFAKLRDGNFIPCCNVFRKTAWDGVGGYKDVGASWEDYALWLNILKRGWSAQRIPQPLFIYRRLEDGRDAKSQVTAPLIKARVHRLHRDLYPPFVSVVIPVYNDTQYLETAIRSASEQTFADLEIVVVSDENTREIEAEIAGIVTKYKAARVVYRQATATKVNTLARARNAGIDAARGLLIFPLDADDRMAPDCLEKLLSVGFSSAGQFAYSDTLIWYGDEPGENTPRYSPHEFPMRNPPPGTYVLDAGDFDWMRVRTRMSFTCSILYAKAAWEKAGGYSPEMSKWGGWEDWDFALSLIERGFTGVHVSHPLVHYRQHSNDQMGKATNDNHPRLREMLRRRHPAIYGGRA